MDYQEANKRFKNVNNYFKSQEDFDWFYKKFGGFDIGFWESEDVFLETTICYLDKYVDTHYDKLFPSFIKHILDIRKCDTTVTIMTSTPFDHDIILRYDEQNYRLSKYLYLKSDIFDSVRYMNDIITYRYKGRNETKCFEAPYIIDVPDNLVTFEKFKKDIESCQLTICTNGDIQYFEDEFKKDVAHIIWDHVIGKTVKFTKYEYGCDFKIPALDIEEIIIKYGL
jgi:hypothetical protein